MGAADEAGGGAEDAGERDLDALRNKGNAPHITRIMPIVFGTETASYQDETYRPTIFGATSLFATLYDVYPEEV